MEKKILVSDLVQYIQKLGMTLNVERALREPEKAKDQAWSILVFLAKQSLGIPNAKLDYIQPDLIHLIEVQKHQNAIVWCNQFGMLNMLFRRLGINYDIHQYFKGDRESLIVALTRILRYKMFKEDFMKKVGSKFNDVSMFEDDLKKHIKNVDKLEMTYLRIKERKQEEAPKYQQFMETKAEIESRIVTKKQQRKQLNSKKIQLQEESDQLVQQQKIKRLQLQEIREQIQQAKKKIAINGPQVKKHLTHLENQYHQIVNNATRVTQERQEKKKICQKYYEAFCDTVKNICSETSSIAESRRFFQEIERQVEEKQGQLNQLLSKSTSLQSSEQQSKKLLNSLQGQSMKIKSINNQHHHTLQVLGKQKQKLVQSYEEISKSALQMIKMQQKTRKEGSVILEKVSQMQMFYTKECNRLIEKTNQYMKFKINGANRIFEKKIDTV